MSEKLLVTDGLRIGKAELSLLQEQVLLNLSRLMAVATTVPANGAVLTTKTTAGVLGTHLKVDVVSNTVTVRAGSGLAADLTYVTVPADTTTISGTFASGTSAKVVLRWAASSAETGTCAVSSGTTLTFSGIAADVLAARYAAGGYIRLAGSAAGNNGTYRILTVGGTTITLAESVPGSDESGLTHSVAGKFFPGYPTSGITDILQHDSYALSYEATSYTLQAGELLLATLAKDGSGTITVTTDHRAPITPQLLGLQLTNANVADTAAIAESKLALSTATTEAQSMRHAQNTDTHTTATVFRVGGASGPRVLTEEDLVVVSPGTPTDPVTVLNAEINLQASFIDLNYTSPDDVDLLYQKNGVRIPQLRLDWGITGTTTGVSGAGTTRTVTIGSGHTLKTGTSLASNALANYVLQDNVGNQFKITANTAVTPGASFTVTVSTPTATTPATSGLCGITTNATSYRLELEREDGTVQVLDVPPFVSGQRPRTLFANVAAQPGSLYDIRLVALNARTTPTSVTSELLNVKWGSSGSTPATDYNVPTASIESSTSGYRVTFKWPHPASFDASKHDYAIAFTTNGTAPTLFTRKANETTSYGYISFDVESYTTVRVAVRVVDMAGTVLSTVDGTASATAINTYLSGTLQTELISFSLADADFTDLGDGLLSKKLRTKLFLQDVKIIGVAVSVTTLTGTSTPTIKGRAWPTGNLSQGVFSEPLDAMGDFLTPVQSYNVGKSLDIGIEKVQGTVTSAVGSILIWYREIGGTDLGTSRGGTSSGGGGGGTGMEPPINAI